MGNDAAAGGFHGFAEFFCDALAVSGTVIDHSNGLAFEGVHSVLAQRATELGVISHHAEGGLKTLAGVLGVGSGRRNLGDASVAINFRSGDRCTGIQVSDHAGDIGVNQLLGHCGALLGIGCVVFSHQLDGDLFAADGHACCVQLFHGHDGAVFVVFTQVGNTAAGRADVADGDHSLGHRKTG